MNNTFRTVRLAALRAAMTVAGAAFSMAVSAAPVPLVNGSADPANDTPRCSAGTAVAGIKIDDVQITEVSGSPQNPATDAVDCWGAFDGNAPSDNAVGDGFEIIDYSDSTYDGIYDYVAKQDMGSTPTGQNIDLQVTQVDSNSGVGTWSFSFANDANLDGRDFMIALKASNFPGYAVWLFAGVPGATSFSGEYTVAWNPDLSNFSVYASNNPAEHNDIPVPAPLALLAIGLVGLRAGGWRRK